ncbi:MAG: SUMF1/EgtB/PvdO family nonheme iron enzyme [Fibrobacteria bacterium]|nr:SUMF1/EgtB/PvdO family nonheme iron enzyme [Fibrobacteria bacterium]
MFLPNAPAPKKTILTVLLLVALVSQGRAEERSTLILSTSPDSAVVVLDDADAPERQKTPYKNESMIPGKHRIVVRSPNPAHVSGHYEVEIPAGETVVLDHVFAYRTKAHGMEALSLAPWQVGADLGFEYHTYLGFNAPSSGVPSKDGATASAMDFSGAYEPDSQPTSKQLPITLRMGLPAGVELRFGFPFAGRTEADGSGGFGLSDVRMGFKWTLDEFNSAVDAQWRFGNAVPSRLGERSNSLQLSAITNQKWKKLDVLGQAGWRGIFRSLDDPDHSPGDAFFLHLRGGLLLADRFLPNLQADAEVRLPDSDSGVAGDAAYHVAIVPGMVLYASRGFDAEIGIPIRPLASNAETFWGLRASVSMRFGLPAPATTQRSVQGAPPGVYAARRNETPISAAGHVLLDAREVTNAEYRAFCDKTAREYPRDPDFPGLPNYFTSPATAKYPVVNISIDDARAYAAWVGKRLPTVDEWKREFMDSQVPANAVACGLEAPEETDSKDQGAGFRHFVGNVAEWVENDRATGSAAYIAGGFFSLPRERCLDKNRWVDIASPMGARYIGVRLVTEVR